VTTACGFAPKGSARMGVVVKYNWVTDSRRAAQRRFRAFERGTADGDELILNSKSSTGDL
jgi:hypothetical protein